MRRGSSVSSFGGFLRHEAEAGYGSHDEELEVENARLKQEVQRLRRQASYSISGESGKCTPRTSTFTALQGRTQEQLREVIEENDSLTEKLKAKEREVEELRTNCMRLRQSMEEQQQVEELASEDKEGSSPKDVRLFKKHAQDIMKRLQAEKEHDLAKADHARKLLKMQLDDSQARGARGKAEIVRLERELSQSEANSLQKQATLEDLQHNYDEVRNMLEGERVAGEQLRLKIQRLEEELEYERMHHREGSETLGMLDGFMHPRGSSVDGHFGELTGLLEEDAGSRPEPEISGKLKEQFLELQQECDHLRSQLATAETARQSGLCPQAQHDTVRPAPERPSSADRATSPCSAAEAAALEELQHECEVLRARLATTEGQLVDAKRECIHLQSLNEQQVHLRKVEASEVAGPLGPAALAEAEAEARVAGLLEELRREQEGLHGQLAESRESEQGLRREAEGLRGQLAESTRSRQDSQRELGELRRQLAESKEVVDAHATPSAVSGQAEELLLLRREREELRERLHEASLAELEAHRKASVVTELMSKIIELQGQLAAAEKSAAEWREVASGPSWSGALSSFICATPERRRPSP